MGNCIRQQTDRGAGLEAQLGPASLPLPNETLMGKPPRAAMFMPLAEPHDYSNIEALIYIKSSSILHNSIGDYKETLPKRKVENEYGRRVISA